MKGIAVIGAGSYGTALAIQLARRGTPVWLWGRDRDALAAMQDKRLNERYLPEAHFPVGLTATADLQLAVSAAEELLIAVPSHALRETLRRIEPLLRPEQGIACAMKGLEAGTGKLVHEVVADELGDARDLAVISGPTFAKELGLGLPTAVTVASANLAYAERIAHALHGDGFRAYTADDIVGVEVGGSVKNVLAIAVGIADGLGLGANTRAALITRGLAEIARLGTALGARRETFLGLAGVGDLILTCTGDLSRNRRVGLLLAEGKSLSAILESLGHVAEGVSTAREVVRLAGERGIDMPIARAVAEVLDGRLAASAAVDALLSREPRAEFR